MTTPSGEFPVHADPFPPIDNNLVRPFDMEFGPDGAAYVLDYGTGYFSGSPEAALYRIELRRRPAVARATDHRGAHVRSGPLDRRVLQ